MKTILVLALLVLLWFAPGLIATWRARRARSLRRRKYWLGGAAAALLPIAVVEIATVADTLGRFDGYCHHAPDITYPCSAPRAVIEAALPSSSFAVFGFLLLGVPPCAWGIFCLIVTVWSTRN